MYLMEKNDKYHVVIKPTEGSKLKYKKDVKESDRLPAHVGHIFRSKEEIKEEIYKIKEQRLIVFGSRYNKKLKKNLELIPN